MCDNQMSKFHNTKKLKLYYLFTVSFILAIHQNYLCDGCGFVIGYQRKRAFNQQSLKLIYIILLIGSVEIMVQFEWLEFCDKESIFIERLLITSKCQEMKRFYQNS